MRYLDIKDFDINNGEGFRVSLWVSGCDFKCPNCHNKEAWDKSQGELFTQDTKDYIYSIIDKELPKDLSILGGEPLAVYNRYDVLDFCREFKDRFPHKNIWLWSGYTIEQIQEFLPEILDYIDVLVDGLYVDNLKDDTLEWRGSSNQRLLRLNK